MTSEPSFLAASRSFGSAHAGSAARAGASQAVVSTTAPRHARSKERANVECSMAISEKLPVSAFA